MLSQINKRIITQRIKCYLHQNLSLSRPESYVNKVQYDRIYKNLSYNDYVDIQNFEYMDNVQKKMIVKYFFKRFGNYNNGCLNDNSMRLFIKNTNFIIRNFDLSLQHNNQFFHSNIYKDLLKQDDTYKKFIEKYNNDIEKNNQMVMLYGLNKTMRHV
jgi:hypothetical protein